MPLPIRPDQYSILFTFCDRSPENVDKDSFYMYPTLDQTSEESVAIALTKPLKRVSAVCLNTYGDGTNDFTDDFLRCHRNSSTTVHVSPGYAIIQNVWVHITEQTTLDLTDATCYLYPDDYPFGDTDKIYAALFFDCIDSSGNFYEKTETPDSGLPAEVVMGFISAASYELFDENFPQGANGFVILNVIQLTGGQIPNSAAITDWDDENDRGRFYQPVGPYLYPLNGGVIDGDGWNDDW